MILSIHNPSSIPSPRSELNLAIFIVFMIVLKLSLVNVSIGIGEFTLAMLYSLLERSCIFIFVRIFYLSGSIKFSISEGANIS